MNDTTLETASKNQEAKPIEKVAERVAGTSLTGKVPAGNGAVPAQTKAPQKRPRDPRLDFFRGLGMFIIFFAHMPFNKWTLWIPARFGFSDATEIFVFCSGMASALAFATVFDNRGWFLGAARVAFRTWQVYWAHICLCMAVFFWTAWLDDVGGFGDKFKAGLNFMNFFERDTAQQLVGLLTLTYVPNYLDILPMYIVILIMIPIVMALSKISPKVAIGFCVMLWLVANVQGTVNWLNDARGGWLHLPAEPFSDRNWFFNPFGWQLIFFTGFAFMRGWLPRPPVHKGLVILCVAILIISLPWAYYRIYGGNIWLYGYHLEWFRELNAWLKTNEFFGMTLREMRTEIRPLIWKSDFGLFRYIHFLALAYVAWVAAGEGGKRLISSGLWGKFVKVIMKVGQQSLAIFLVSMVLSRVLGFPLQIAVSEYDAYWSAFGSWFGYPELKAPDPGGPNNAYLWVNALMNFIGIFILIGVAYTTAWFKSQPWRKSATG